MSFYVAQTEHVLLRGRDQLVVMHNW